MGAATKYPPPHIQLGQLAVSARQRGLSFDDFWREAIRPSAPIVRVTDANPPPNCVLWPSDPPDRRATRDALIATREAWRRAYEREPQTRSERAVEMLGVFLPDLDGMEIDDDEPALGLAG